MSASSENEYKKLSDDQGKEQVVTDQAIYNMVMYLPLDQLGLEGGEKVSVIITRARTRAKAEKAKGNDVDYEGALEALEAVAKSENASCLEATISNMSFNHDDDLVKNPDAFSAAVFTLNGEKSVNFRGTPGGAWMDNSDNLNGCPGNPYTANGNTWNYLSAIDIATLKYIESLDEKQLEQFIISGHSKGGHEALLVALVYPERVSACYAFDGQSISPEMWEEIKQLYRDDPEKLRAIREKINAINVENDYVHPLGWTEEDGYIARNIYMIKGSAECDTNPAANHYSQAFFTIGEDGKLQLNDALEKEGPLAEFLKQVSGRIMQLPPEERKPVADSIMAICQAFLGKKFPVNFSTRDLLETIANMDNGMATACEILKDVLQNTEEGAALIEYLKEIPVAEFILTFVEEHPFISKGIASAVTPLIFRLLNLGIIVCKGAEIIVFIEDFGAALIKNIENAAQWLYKAGCALIDGLTQKIEEAGRVITEFAVKTKYAIEKAVKQGLLILKHQLNQLAENIKAAAARVQDFVSGLVDKAQETFRALANSLSQGIEACKTAVSNMQEKIKTGLKHVGEKITQTFDAAKGKIVAFATSVQNNITNAVQKGQAILKNGIERVKAGLKSVGEQVKASAVQTVQALAGVVSGALGVCQQAIMAGAEKIKDTVHMGISNLKDTIQSMGGWLKEKTGIAIETAKNAIKGGMTGRVGIDYAMIQRARRQIEEFSDAASHLERLINDILSDLSTLRYANISTAQLTDAKAQITRQRNYMNVHSNDLGAYENACRKTEAGFVSALHSFA